MARTVRNAKIDTPSGRARLPVRREPHWTVISQGAALGYRKGTKGGTWIARLRDDAGKQHYEALGAADDARDANGDDVLSFAQAQVKARAWFERKRRTIGDDAEEEGSEADAGPFTVARCLERYLTWYRRHNKPGGFAWTKSAVAAHILPALGEVPCEKLTPARIRRWHEAMATSPALLRTGRGRERNTRPTADDPDAIRARKATANRVLTILKAALNKAFANGLIVSDDAWRRVKPFKNVDSARVRYLSDDECRRLVNGCDPSFRALVQAALFTGGRYAELAALRVGDFNPDAGTLHVRTSKSGHGRHVVLTDEGRAFFARQALGKASDARLFPRPDGTAWGKSQQQRPLATACQRAAIEPAVGFHQLRHTHASRLARHGAPLLVIAQQLGHTSARMVERHYAHLSPNFVADAVRQAFGPLGIGGGDEKVTILRGDQR